MRPLIGIPGQSRSSSRYRRYCGEVSYCRAVERAGGLPLLLPLVDDEAVLETMRRLDGLLLAGGGDVDPVHFGQPRLHTVAGVDEARDRVELLVTREAIRKGVPLLAICRGIQVLNVAMGGTLYQDIEAEIVGAMRHNFADSPRDCAAHEVSVLPSSKLSMILGATRFHVNSFHHQAIRQVATGLRVTARSADDIVEAVETDDGTFALGVQWHPEGLLDTDPRMLRIFAALVSAASGHSEHACRHPQ